jgi:hypothetical protein
MRVFVFSFIIILLSISFAIKDVNVATKDSNLLKYYPTKEMVKIFKSKSQNEGFTHIVDRIEGNKVQIKQVDLLTRVAMVYEIAENYIKLVFTEEVGNNDFKENYIQGLQPNREDYILKAPLAVGTKWYDDIGGVFEIIKTNAIVETSAGTFETLVVRYTNDDFTVKEYYSADVGLVKIILNNYAEFELVQINPIL